MTNKQFNGKQFDAVWTERFSFYQENGAPSAPQFKQAIKGLQGISKLRVNFNFYAFFFGFIYFLIKGMWKGALSILLLSGVVFGLTSFLPEIMSKPLSIIIALIAGYTANYHYYRNQVLGEDDFNIFKGMQF